MTDEREREMRDILAWAKRSEFLNVSVPVEGLDVVTSLLNRERERVDKAEKVVEGMAHHLATCKEQVAELLEALEAIVRQGHRRDGLRVQYRFAVEVAEHALAKHKERV